MDLTLGDATFALRAPWRHPVYSKQRPHGGPVFGVYPRHVFAWDHTLGPLNAIRSDFVTIGPTMGILAMNDDGTPNREAAQAQAHDLLSRTGFRDFAALNAALFEAHPLQSVAVPWERLLQDVDLQGESFTAVAWTDPVTANAMDAADDGFVGVLLNMPRKLWFQLIKTGGSDAVQVSATEEASGVTAPEALGAIWDGVAGDTSAWASEREVDLAPYEAKIAAFDAERRASFAKQLSERSAA